MKNETRMLLISYGVGLGFVFGSFMVLSVIFNLFKIGDWEFVRLILLPIFFIGSGVISYPLTKYKVSFRYEVSLISMILTILMFIVMLSLVLIGSMLYQLELSNNITLTLNLLSLAYIVVVLWVLLYLWLLFHALGTIIMEKLSKEYFYWE